ncbi:putative serine protease inhibitor, Ecotin family [Campylobacter blaseri]|uniref:Ecotin n=1 Tax=Campylobacter blaseri TaxID=2042961 RepID=A0A2P8R415_9BACT|nr:ecotin family protein [Campylobacter blaseri]PSM53209.1 ecotin [Campylobacter blaseri]PSM54675.1 ecotin [Campylobacter blaseri]QKF86848.1 putative serine protease inhibitor, Ecotin family [Campylobacter blaseri]
MKKLIIFFIVVVMGGLSLNASDTTMFPKAKKGYVKHVIELEEKEDESKFKIEVAFGKEKLVDCNLHQFLDSSLTTKTLDGYGYNYYEFDKSSDDMRSTMMFCDGARMEKFIYYPSKIEKSYNSRLPLVIYTPKDVNVEVRIFKEIDKFIK